MLYNFEARGLSEWIIVPRTQYNRITEFEIVRTVGQAWYNYFLLKTVGLALVLKVGRCGKKRLVDFTSRVL